MPALFAENQRAILGQSHYELARDGEKFTYRQCVHVKREEFPEAVAQVLPSSAPPDRHAKERGAL